MDDELTRYKDFECGQRPEITLNIAAAGEASNSNVITLQASLDQGILGNLDP